MELMDESNIVPRENADLLASQRRLEREVVNGKLIKRKSESQRFQLQAPVNASYYITQCYLILSIYAKHFIGYYGHPRPYLDRSYFKLSGTPPEMNRYTKLTVSTNILFYMNKAEQCLKRHINHLQNQLSHKQKQKYPLELIPLSNQHCTICFKTNHLKPNCKNCSYCSSELHLRKFCPELQVEQPFTLNLVTPTTTNPRYKVYRQLRKEIRRQERKQFENRIWFRTPNQFNPELIYQLEPIGIEQMQRTVALDIEGNGNGGLGNVHISGWFGKIKRIQTVYYAEIKDVTVVNPNTRITGLQITDLINGTPFAEVKQKILTIINGLRVITQGSSDFEKLQITTAEIQRHKIDHIDLQQIWPGRQPLGLKNIDMFFYPDHNKLKRDDPTSVIYGHSPERDSRVTLKAYMEFIRLTQQSRVPTTEEIRDMVKCGLSVKDW